MTVNVTAVLEAHHELLEAFAVELSVKQASQDELEESVDVMWVCLCATLVFFMQAGFTMLESGSVRPKNNMNILLKNVLDTCIGVVSWLLIGASLQYDGDGVLADLSSDSVLLLGQSSQSNSWMARWFFGWSLSVLSATIVTGAMAERTSLIAFMTTSAVVTAFIYPIVARSVWHEKGWMSLQNPDAVVHVMDFAGGCVVHVTGGFVALTGAAMLGPRRGRFDPVSHQPIPMQGHNASMQVLGAFVLWFGWYGFNCGSTLEIANHEATRRVEQIAASTTIAAGTAGLAATLLDRFLSSRTWSVPVACNGMLSGLVSITAGCPYISPQLAILVGVVGAALYLGASRFTLLILRADDPLDAFPVHGVCGIWSTIASALFANPLYLDPERGEVPGLFYGDATPLGAAVLACVFTVAWSVSISGVVFLVLKRYGVLRIDIQSEMVGLDVAHHGAQSTETHPLVGKEESKSLPRFASRSDFHSWQMSDSAAAVHISGAPAARMNEPAGGATTSCQTPVDTDDHV